MVLNEDARQPLAQVRPPCAVGTIADDPGPLLNEVLVTRRDGSRNGLEHGAFGLRRRGEGYWETSMARLRMVRSTASKVGSGVTDRDVCSPDIRYNLCHDIRSRL